MGKIKGNRFEREVCKVLSEWWTGEEPGGPRADVFWRTANSGGRATVRGKQKQQTVNSYGDVMAADPVGKPLLDVVTIELKRGRSSYTIQDLLDASEWAAEQMYAKWIAKAGADAKAAGTPYWLLVVRRDKRLPLVLYPFGLFEGLRQCTGGSVPNPKAVLFLEGLTIYTDTLGEFLMEVEPDHFRNLAEGLVHGPAD